MDIAGERLWTLEKHGSTQRFELRRTNTGWTIVVLKDETWALSYSAPQRASALMLADRLMRAHIAMGWCLRGPNHDDSGLTAIS